MKELGHIMRRGARAPPTPHHAYLGMKLGWKQATSCPLAVNSSPLLLLGKKKGQRALPPLSTGWGQSGSACRRVSLTENLETVD